MATPDQQTPVADGDITGTVVEAIDSFDAMGLSEPLLRGIYAYGFEKSRLPFRRYMMLHHVLADAVSSSGAGSSDTGLPTCR